MKINYGLKFYREVFGLESLHWGYWADNAEPTIENLKKAQNDYIERVLGWIPAGVVKVLDVGCGLGSVALKLVEKGYKVSCVSPDVYQREVFLEKTRGAVPFMLTKFEDMKPDGKYDLVLMCESVQYLDLRRAFVKCAQSLGPGGYVLAADYFRKEDTPYYRTCRVESAFLDSAVAGGFEMVKSEDITGDVTPTLEAARRVYERYGLPVFELIAGYLSQELPLAVKIVSFFLKKKIRKLNRYVYEHTPQKLDAGMFRERMKYGIYLFRLNPHHSNKEIK
jgi:SAM-dependent methyltransferase